MSHSKGTVKLQKARSDVDLRASRQRRGVSLEQIAEQTKISIRFLRAIEAQQFEQLPSGIFAISYLRQYAGTVGVDAESLIAAYRARCGAEETQEQPAAKGASLMSWMRFLKV